VSLIAYRLQAKTAKSDQQKELADQIDAIQQQMAKLGPMSPSGNSLAAIANIGNVNAALQALLLRVATLIASAELDLDWYQNLVLAMASLEVGDVTNAGPYAESAVTLAHSPQAHGLDPGTASFAQMVSLGTRAAFHFSRGLDGDEEKARDDYDAARKVVHNSRDRQGPHITCAQFIDLYVGEANWELETGHPDHAIGLMAKACHEWLRIRVPLARQSMGSYLITFVSNQNWVPADRLLTDEFRQAWDKLQRDHPVIQAPVPGPGALAAFSPLGPSAAEAYPSGPPAAGAATAPGPDR
jgi:hypothetical protein